MTWLLTKGELGSEHALVVRMYGFFDFDVALMYELHMKLRSKLNIHA